MQTTGIKERRTIAPLIFLIAFLGITICATVVAAADGARGSGAGDTPCLASPSPAIPAGY